VPKAANWAINLGILALIIAAYVANRQANYVLERMLVAILVGAMALTIFYGVLKLRQMQEDYDARLPAKEPK